MDFRKITKTVVEATVEYGAGLIIYQIIKNNVTVDRIDKTVSVAVASFAIGNVVSKAASKNATATVDTIFDAVEKFKKNKTE